MPKETFTPALGHSALTPLYDAAIRLMTRERRWRVALIEQIDPGNRDAILDVGCGTGSLAILLKRQAPHARVVGLDPDPTVLSIAAEKAKSAGVVVEWRGGFARGAAHLGEFDHVVSTLVFHQVPEAEKVAGTRSMFSAVRAGGFVHIADYCRQPDWLTRQLFRIIQAVDGRENTQANVEGAVERNLALFSPEPIRPEQVVRTPTGAISLFRVRKSSRA